MRHIMRRCTCTHEPTGKREVQIKNQPCKAHILKQRAGSLGEAEGVKDAAGVAVLAGALEEALQAHEAALLGLAARAS